MSNGRRGFLFLIFNVQAIMEHKKKLGSVSQLFVVNPIFRVHGTIDQAAKPIHDRSWLEDRRRIVVPWFQKRSSGSLEWFDPKYCGYDPRSPKSLLLRPNERSLYHRHLKHLIIVFHRLQDCFLLLQRFDGNLILLVRS